MILLIFVKKTDFDDKLKKINKKVTSNKTKDVEAKELKKVTGLTNKVAQISEKGYDFLLDKMYFIGNDGYQNFLVSSLVCNRNKKLLTGYWPECHL